MKVSRKSIRDQKFGVGTLFKKLYQTFAIKKSWCFETVGYENEPMFSNRNRYSILKMVLAPNFWSLIYFLHAFLTEDDFSTYNFAFSCSPFLNYQTFFSLCAKLKIGGCSFFQKMQYFRRIKLSTIFFGIFLINIDQPMCFEAPRLNRFLWNRNFTFVLYRNNKTIYLWVDYHYWGASINHVNHILEFFDRLIPLHLGVTILYPPPPPFLF